MPIEHRNVVSLLESIRIDKFYVVCHFKCNVKNRTIISTVPFEPYDGKIELKWTDIVFRPIQSYNKYYHTPITIYGDKSSETIVLKAFKNVSKHFTWNKEEQKFIIN